MITDRQSRARFRGSAFEARPVPANSNQHPDNNEFFRSKWLGRIEGHINARHQISAAHASLNEPVTSTISPDSSNRARRQLIWRLPTFQLSTDMPAVDENACCDSNGRPR